MYIHMLQSSQTLFLPVLAGIGMGMDCPSDYQEAAIPEESKH